MNDLISIIVPIYNVEPYLRKCVSSILEQTYQNLEIILVDDGSPDNCSAICDEYSEKDARIRVIHKENGGLSDARNAGLDIMTGKYVGFVDSDDWIEPDMYEKLLENMKSFEADMSFGGVADELEKDGAITTIKVSDYGSEPFAESSVDAMKRYFLGSWAAWDKLYKATLFDDIRYPKGEINEDEAIVLQLLHQCKKVCYTNQVFYHYMKREQGESITMSSFSIKDLAWKKHCKENLFFIRERYPELERYAAKRYRDSLMWHITKASLLEDYLPYEAELNQIISELRKERLIFGKIPMESKKMKMQYYIALIFGFKFYRFIFRLKRGLYI